jgi:hypothetical protein
VADDKHLRQKEWEPFGSVMLDGIDSALADRTKVPLAVDLVRNLELPFVPEPSTGLRVGLGVALLACRRERGRR